MSETDLIDLLRQHPTQVERLREHLEGLDAILADRDWRETVLASFVRDWLWACDQVAGEGE